MEIRTKAIVFHEEGLRSAKEIGEPYNISDRTARRWAQNHRKDPENGLRPKKTGPERSPRTLPASLEQRIIRLKGRYPAWGARRIKHQVNLPCSWRTVHRILRKHGLLIRIKPKPQSAGTRFQRRHVDSMWQGDTFQFRIRGVGKVYITGFTDDCSRYRVRSKVYLHKDAASAVNALRWALRAGRIPREIYVDNGKQFVSILFKAEAQNHGINLILELRSPLQQQAGDPERDDPGIRLSQRNEFQQKQKMSTKRTKTLSTKWTVIVALYNYTILDSWWIATSEIYGPDVTARVILDTEDQFFNDHLHGQGIVAPDEYPDDYMVYWYEWPC